MATTYTRGQWSIAVINQILRDTGGGVSTAGAVQLFVGWTVAEFSAAESKIATYNCLNCENGADIQTWNPKAVMANGIVAFPTFADGVNATAHRLVNNPAYKAIVDGIHSNNLNIRELSNDDAVKRALGVWVNGPRGGPISQSYVDNIIAGSKRGDDVLQGVDGDSTITSQDAQGNDMSQGSGPSFSAVQVVKVLGGALMILAGVALLLKSLAPGIIQTAIGTTVKSTGKST